jgi:prolyl-tRNA synthetase
MTGGLSSLPGSLQAVIVPTWKNDTQRGEFIAVAQRLGASFAAEGISCRVDERDVRPAWKYYEWERKGVPVRVEIGPRDAEQKQVMIVRRDPLDAAPSPGACISCGAPSTHRPVFALAY